jgi:hypothetical protein
MSGKIPAAEVTGGLPEGVLQHDPMSGRAARGDGFGAASADGGSPTAEDPPPRGLRTP